MPEFLFYFIFYFDFHSCSCTLAKGILGCGESNAAGMGTLGEDFGGHRCEGSTREVLEMPMEQKQLLRGAQGYL